MANRDPLDYNERDEDEDGELALLNQSLEAADPEFDVQSGEELVASLPDPEDVPREIRVAFWTVVILLNGALLAGSVGILVAVLLGWWRWGVVLTGSGILLAGMAYRRYRLFMAQDTD